MLRRLPLVPTIFLIVTMPVLLGLGLWQLQRAQWKSDLLMQLAAAKDAPAIDLGAARLDTRLGFRSLHVAIDCPPQKPDVRAGRNHAGQPGFVYHLACRTAGGDAIGYVIGWNNRPDVDWGPPALRSDRIMAAGVLVETGRDDPRFELVSARAVPPLMPAAPPTTDSIPNNHRGYAMQWFAFALVLAAIYGLYVRRWRQDNAAELAKSDLNG